MFLAPGQDPEERITVVNVENGSRLTGNKAPKRIDLPMWLISHPNYLPDESEIVNLALKQSQINAQPDKAIEQTTQQQQQQRRSGKSLKQSHMAIPHDENDEDSLSPKPSISRHSNLPPNQKNSVSRPDRAQATPPPMQPNNSLQASAVILFNKQSGKKLPPQKLPTWKSLCAFLDRNQVVYIDPKSNDMIKQKFGSTQQTPSIIRSRQINSRSSNVNSGNNNNQQHQSKINHGDSSNKSPPPRTSHAPRTNDTPNQRKRNLY